MGFFSGPDEVARKANLKVMEDKRLAFAQAMQARGFAPERMLMSQREDGGLMAVCRFGGKCCLIVGPGFGKEGDFELEEFDRFDVRIQQVSVKAEGMGGIFGFGKRGQHGIEYHITRHDGSEAVMPFVFGRNTWAEFTLPKNPLLKTRRRRGDANVVWDLKPIESNQIQRILDLADSYLG
ncbi:MAG: hypothetical protein IJJ45_09220 [Clostridia bacterium]|nr:hypothetical protein [Clostridia bacterium]